MEQSFESRIDHLDKLNMHYFEVDETILRFFEDDSTKSVYNQRFEITVNDKVSWKGGTVSLGNGKAYITLSAARMKKLGVHRDDCIKVKLVKDQSEYGFDVPEEFTEVLLQDHQARERFEGLNKGFQRYIIYLVLQIKSSQKRIEKSIFYLENLKKAPSNATTMRHILGKDLP